MGKRQEEIDAITSECVAVAQGRAGCCLLPLSMAGSHVRVALLVCRHRSRRFDVEKAHLAELEEHFRKVGRNQARAAAEEAREAKLQAQRDAKQKAIWDGACTKIQSLWRGYWTRKHLAELLPKKKKGKGKGKGKGGKKKKKK